MSDDNILLNNEEDYEADIITLQDEEGNEHEFEVIDAADIEGERYLALIPRLASPDSLDEDSEMLIMRAGEENGEEFLDIVDDEEELQMVGQVFLNRLGEMFEIDLEELEQEAED